MKGFTLAEGATHVDLPPTNAKAGFTLAEGATYVGLLPTNAKVGFTLAEVLITLGIIGIVAAMTIPALSTKINEHILVNKLKKFYSTFAQAMKLNEEQNPGSSYTLDHYLDAFSIKTICKSGDISCAPMTYKTPRGQTTSSWGRNDSQKSKVSYAILADGAIIRYTAKVGDNGINGTCNGVLGTSDALMSVCAEVSVDLNGNKLPNTLGKDVFYFYVTSLGVIPFGDSHVTDKWGSASTCKTEGLSCANYVLKHGTLDYNKYSD